MAPQTLAEIYVEQDKWQDRRRAAERRRALAEKRIDQCSNHLGAYRVAEQVAALMAPAFPDYQLDVLGPHGLMHQVSIHAYRRADLVGSDRARLRAAGGLSFRPGKLGRLELIDHSNPNPTYASGSIAALNGMQYDSKPIFGGIDGLVELLQKSIDNKR